MLTDIVAKSVLFTWVSCAPGAVCCSQRCCTGPRTCLWSHDRAMTGTWSCPGWPLAAKWLCHCRCADRRLGADATAPVRSGRARLLGGTLAGRDDRPRTAPPSLAPCHRCRPDARRCCLELDLTEVPFRRRTTRSPAAETAAGQLRPTLRALYEAGGTGGGSSDHQGRGALPWRPCRSCEQALRPSRAAASRPWPGGDFDQVGQPDRVRTGVGVAARSGCSPVARRAARGGVGDPVSCAGPGQTRHRAAAGASTRVQTRPTSSIAPNSRRPTESPWSG